MTTRIQPNGVICDRCRFVLATRANDLIEGYEYVCPGCMTAAELIAFGLEANA